MLQLDTEVVGDHYSAYFMVKELFGKLEPAPMSGWLLGFAQPVVKEGTDRAFATESEPAGNPWAPLAPSTIDDRVSQGFGEGPIQIRTGELAGYFDDAQSAIIATQIGVQMKWPGELAQGDRLPYKVWSAQYGNARTGAPPRPVMGLTVSDAAEITTRLFFYLLGGQIVK